MKIEFRFSSTFYYRWRNTIQKTLECAEKSLSKKDLRRFHFFENACIEVFLVGSAKMKTINSNTRQKDKVTDVLSFPTNSSTPHIEGMTHLGSIVICIPQAEQQRKTFHCSLKFEIERLTVHGFLHLLGYDHELGAKEEKIMFKLEDKILKNLKCIGKF